MFILIRSRWTFSGFSYALTKPYNRTVVTFCHLLTTDGYVKTLATNSLLFDTGYNSNNGTYTCIASNGIGQAAQVSFDVGVYGKKTTILSELYVKDCSVLGRSNL